MHICIHIYVYVYVYIHRGPIRSGFTDGWVQSQMPQGIHPYPSPSGRMTDGGFEPPIPIRPDDGWGFRV